MPVEPEQSRPWLCEGTTRLLALVDDLDDASFAGPSLLRGWTRAHVVGHLARNAEALGRLVAWAATGIETPMYSGPDQRAADIEASAVLPPGVLRSDVRDTAAALAAALDGLDDAAWQARVRSALGREIPASQVPWMRVREVWLHAVDLDAGAKLGDVPAPLVDALLDDITATLSVKPDCPGVQLQPVDRTREWALGPPDRVAVRAPAAELLGWVSGRAAGPELRGGLPLLPAWI